MIIHPYKPITLTKSEPVELCAALPTLGQILLQGVSHYLQQHHELSKPTANFNSQ